MQHAFLLCSSNANQKGMGDNIWMTYVYILYAWFGISEKSLSESYEFLFQTREISMDIILIKRKKRKKRKKEIFSLQLFVTKKSSLLYFCHDFNR